MLGSSLWEHWHDDNTVLLAPTPSEMRKLLQICEQYAQEYSITFNAKKSKCTVAAPRNRRHLLLGGNICPFVIDGSSIDFVDSFPQFGHIISSVSGDNEDISPGDASLFKPIVYYVTFGTLAQMRNIGCLNLFTVICMV